MTEYNGNTIGIVQGYLGAAGSDVQLEELIALGFKKFIVCGVAGVLKRDIQVGHLIDCITDYLQSNKIPFIKAKTWTTDAFYRETEKKIALRVSEGCVTVEMEAAAFFAVAEFRNVILGQLYLRIYYSF